MIAEVLKKLVGKDVSSTCQTNNPLEFGIDDETEAFEMDLSGPGCKMNCAGSGGMSLLA